MYYRAFLRFQLPFGADQERRMTRWTNRVNHRLKQMHIVDLFFGDDAATAWNKDMKHCDSGAEGLLGSDLLPNPHT